MVDKVSNYIQCGKNFVPDGVKLNEEDHVGIDKNSDTVYDCFECKDDYQPVRYSIGNNIKYFSESDADFWNEQARENKIGKIVAINVYHVQNESYIGFRLENGALVFSSEIYGLA